MDNQTPSLRILSDSTHSYDNKATVNAEKQLPLRCHVQHAVEQYFKELEGEPTTNLYQTILQEVEKPLLEVVLSHTQGNQSKTALILGLNRGTLRKKMQQYDLM